MMNELSGQIWILASRKDDSMGMLNGIFPDRHMKTKGYLVLTNTVGASPVVRFVTNTAKNMTLVVVVTVEPTPTTSADGRRKSMERVSNLGLELELLAHIRSLYKGDFYYQKAEMNGRQRKKCLLNTPRPCEYYTNG